jgi:hypothetical protein
MYAMVVLTVSIYPIVIGLPDSILSVLQTNPTFSKGIWIAVIGGLLYKKLYLTALVVTVVGLIVRFEITTSYMYSPEGIMAEYAALNERDPRFNKMTEVDLQIGEGTLQRDPARFLDSGKPPRLLLFYPPTDSQLKAIGNNGHS